MRICKKGCKVAQGLCTYKYVIPEAMFYCRR